jgi:signal transduction histidine kinase
VLQGSLPAGPLLQRAAAALGRNALLAALLTVPWFTEGYISFNLQPARDDSIWLYGWTAAWQAFAAFGITLLFVSVGLAVVPQGGKARLPCLVALWLLTCWLSGVLWGHAQPLNVYGRISFGLVPMLSAFWQGCIGVATILIVQQVFAQRSRDATEALHAAEMRHLAAQAALSQAHFHLLEAQIEPHFLFNALANVRRLLRTDVPAARSLLGDLLRYFEEALPRLRDPQSTLAHEAELVRAFLAVHSVRMGARLRVALDIPAELSQCSLPPMTLLTLVENALKHGLQPMLEGGSIHVAAQASGGRLRLTVADDGRGMGQGSGSGTGLLNLRARLKALYGGAASLSLRMNQPRGVVAIVWLPKVYA